MCCNKCMKIGGILFVVLGLLFLLQDLAIWDFWSISWYTALFLIVGISGFAMSKCPECHAVRSGKKK